MARPIRTPMNARRSLAAGLLLTVVSAFIVMHPATVNGQGGRGGPDVLMLRGPGSFIGVEVRELDTAERAKSADGVAVTRVQPESPAARAGIQDGDVVLEFDGERVRSTRQFQRLVEETPPGREVRATIRRAGSQRTVAVTPELGRAQAVASSALKSPPELLLRPGTGAPVVGQFLLTSGPGRLGASIVGMDASLAEYFGVKEGALVTAVPAGTPAAAAGLLSGDVIAQVAGRPVPGADAAIAAIRDAPAGTLELRVIRKGKEITLTAKLPDAVRLVR